MFPNETAGEPYLWSSIATLSKISEVWRAMFSISGMSESEQKLKSLHNASLDLRKELDGILQEHDKKRQGDHLPVYLPDSDDEAERDDLGDMQVVATSTVMSAHREGAAQPLIPDVRYVIIEDVRHKTLHAILQWEQTGRIEFAKLTSSGSKQASTLASPKSVYIAADRYQITEVAKLALADYRSQLSADNVMAELFSEHAYAHRELERVAKEVAVAKWKDVKAAGVLKSIHRACETGRLGPDEALKMATDLMEMVG